MALIFEQYLTAEMGDASYLVGDDETRTAAVVDPQVDVQRYVDALRRHGLALKFVVQTHVHEDFLSGATALCDAVPGAQLCVSGEDAPEYGFRHRLVHDGDQLTVGKIELTVKHTPGHTPEHISILLAKTATSPFAVLSGGSLLVNAAGRTDLLGPAHIDDLTFKQYRTLTEFFLKLEDGVAVYPTHVHGSPCGAAIGDKTSTTIGFERLNNKLLQPADEASFKELALSNLPPKPSYYPRLKERNTNAQPSMQLWSPIRPLPPSEFQHQARSGAATLIDTRHMLAFGGGHVQGALNIAAVGHAGIWAGWMLDDKQPLMLIVESDAQLSTVAMHFARTGFSNFAGYLAGGMTAWENAGFISHMIRQLHVKKIEEEQLEHRLLVIDVRSPQEWGKGHIPGAIHIFLPELPKRIHEIDKSRPIAVYCDSGYRASIGASLLKAAGYDAANIPGSWQAWTANGLAISK